MLLPCFCKRWIHMNMELISLQMHVKKSLPDSSIPLAALRRVLHHISLRDVTLKKTHYFSWSYESLFFKRNGASILLEKLWPQFSGNRRSLMIIENLATIFSKLNSKAMWVVYMREVLLSVSLCRLYDYYQSNESWKEEYRYTSSHQIFNCVLKIAQKSCKPRCCQIVQGVDEK